MKKSLLALLVLIVGACSVTPDEKEPVKTFGEMAQGTYEMGEQELELKADGHFYDGTTIVYTMVEDRGEGKAVYSMTDTAIPPVTKYFGFSIKVDGDTKTLTMYIKTATEYWDVQSDVSFDSKFKRETHISIPAGGGEDKPLDPAEAKAFIDKVNNENLYHLVNSTLTAFPKMSVEDTITLEIYSQTGSEKKEFKLAHLRNETDAIFTNGIGADTLYVGITFRKKTLDQQDQKDYNKDYTKDNISWSLSTALAVVNDATAAQKSAFAKKVNDAGLKIVDSTGAFINFIITPEGTFDSSSIVSVINDTTALVIESTYQTEVYQVELRGEEFGTIHNDGKFNVIAFIPNTTAEAIKIFADKIKAEGLSFFDGTDFVDFTIAADGTYTVDRSDYKIGKIIDANTVLVSWSDTYGTGTKTHGLIGTEYGRLDDGTMGNVLAFKKATAGEIATFATKIKAEGLVFEKNGDFVDFTIAADGTYSANSFDYKIGKIIDANTVLVLLSDTDGIRGTETHGLRGTDFGDLHYDGLYVDDVVAFKKATPEAIKTFADKMKAEGLVFAKDGDFVDFTIAADGTYTIDRDYKIGKIIDANTVLVLYSDTYGNTGTQTHRLIGTQYGYLRDGQDGLYVDDVLAFKKATAGEIATFATKINNLSLTTKDGISTLFKITADGTYSANGYDYKIGKIIDDNTVLVLWSDTYGSNTGTQTHGLIGTQYGVLDDGTMNTVLAFKKVTAGEIATFATKIKAEGLVFEKNGDFVDFTIAADGTYSANSFDYKIGKIIDANTVLVSYSDTAGNTGTETHGLIGTQYSRLNSDGTMGKVLAFKKATAGEIATFATKINNLSLTIKDGTSTLFTITDGTYSVSQFGSLTTYKIGKIINDNTVLVSYSDTAGNTGTETHGLVGTKYGVLNYNGTAFDTVLAEK